MDDLMNSREAAQFLRVHKITLYRWIKDRGLPSMRAASRLRFSRRQLLEWMEVTAPQDPLVKIQGF